MKQGSIPMMRARSPRVPEMMPEGSTEAGAALGAAKAKGALDRTPNRYGRLAARRIRRIDRGCEGLDRQAAGQAERAQLLCRRFDRIKRRANTGQMSLSRSSR